LRKLYKKQNNLYLYISLISFLTLALTAALFTSIDSYLFTGAIIIISLSMLLVKLLITADKYSKILILYFVLNILLALFFINFSEEIKLIFEILIGFLLFEFIIIILLINL